APVLLAVDEHELRIEPGDQLEVGVLRATDARHEAQGFLRRDAEARDPDQTAGDAEIADGLGQARDERDDASGGQGHRFVPGRRRTSKDTPPSGAARRCTVAPMTTAAAVLLHDDRPRSPRSRRGSGSARDAERQGVDRTVRDLELVPEAPRAPARASAPIATRPTGLN